MLIIYGIIGTKVHDMQHSFSDENSNLRNTSKSVQMYIFQAMLNLKLFARQLQLTKLSYHDINQLTNMFAQVISTSKLVEI